MGERSKPPKRLIGWGLLPYCPFNLRAEFGKIRRGSFQITVITAAKHIQMQSIGSFKLPTDKYMNVRTSCIL